MLLRRTVELVVSLLGVVKAGGVYVPLDAEYPFERAADVGATVGSGCC